MKRKMQKRLRNLLLKGVGFGVFMVLLFLADNNLPDALWVLAVKLGLLCGVIYCLYGVLNFSTKE